MPVTISMRRIRLSGTVDPELIRDGECGIVIRERSPAAVAEAMATALDRRWDRQRIACSAALRSWETVAEEQIQLYLKVLADSPRLVRAPGTG